MAKNIKSDKFVLYVERPSTTFPLVRLFKCNKQSNIEGEVSESPIWDIKNNYDNTALDIGRAILENSQIVQNWKLSHP